MKQTSGFFLKFLEKNKKYVKIFLMIILNGEIVVMTDIISFEGRKSQIIAQLNKYMSKEDAEMFFLKHFNQNKTVNNRLIGGLLKIMQEKSTAKISRAFCGMWQQPILPDGCPSSTFGAAELNFCVRNENRWILSAIVTTMAI